MIYFQLLCSHQSSLPLSTDLILLVFLVHSDCQFLLHSTIQSSMIDGNNDLLSYTHITYTGVRVCYVSIAFKPRKF